MAAIILPHRWSRQPSVSLPAINWAHPSARALSYAGVFVRGKVVDLVTGKTDTSSFGTYPGIGSGAGPAGPAFGVSQASSTGGPIFYGPGSALAPVNGTHLIVGRLNGISGSYAGWFSVNASTGASNHFAFQANPAGTAISLWRTSAEENASELDTLSNFADGQIHAWSVSLLTTAAVTYKDGRYFKSHPALTPTSPTDARINYFGERNALIGYGSGGLFAAHFIWTRGHAESEQASLSQNPWQLLAPLRRRIYIPSAAAGGQSATVNQATETDLAQAIARSKAKLLGQTTETDLAQAISQLKRAALGQVAETDTAQAITTAKRVQLGQVTETDLAQAITAAAANQAAQVTETDLAQALTARKTLAFGQTTETDTAQAIARAKAKQLGQTTETDTAQAIAHAKAKQLGQVTETDLAQTVTPSVPNQLGQATETDTAQAVTHAKAKQLGQVTETDAAQAVSRLKTAIVNLALEIDLGQPITWAPKVRILGQVLETDLAQPIAGALASTVLPQGKLFTVGARAGFVVGPRSGFRVDQ